MQFLGIDPAPWNNPGKWIFGTLGNPNYLSSFLALSTIATFYCALKEKKTISRLFYSTAALFQIAVVVLSKSSQGLILVAFGIFAFTVIFCFQRSRILGWASFLLGLMAGLISVLGIFQFGPFSKYLYQDSISYRGDYWRAGIQMFERNWVHGVGLDSYGDFYRMYRDATAANRHEVEVVSTTAHNLFIDLAATGGIFLITGYLLIIGLVGSRILARFKGPEKVELEYKVLVVLWVAFNLQTIISINVPSLAIWVFMFFGLLLNTENQTVQRRNVSSKEAKKAPRKFIALSTVCCLAFISILAPLVSRDVKLAKVLRENDIPKITEVILSFPRDADQIAGIAVAYEKLERSKEALDLAQVSLLENSNSARSWQVVFNSPVASSADKIKARGFLEKLDPYYASGLG
jgi:O-antigen ligase